MGHTARVADTEPTPAVARGALLLEYDGFRVRVQSHESSHLEWLLEFLGPAFSVREGSRCDFAVELSEDTPRYEALARLGPISSGDEVEVFALDNHVLRLPVWNGLSHGLTLFDEQFGVYYEIPGGRREVRLVTSLGNSAARTSLMRVVRERVMSEMLRIGRLILHASSVLIEGLGLVIAGPTSSGKTSLSTALLQSESARYVSNDRAVIALDEAPPRFRGLPSVITLRPRTLELFPGLAKELRETATHPRISRREAAASPRSGPLRWSDGRYGLSPPQWCSLLARQSVAEADVSAVLFPRVVEQPDRIELARLTPGEAEERLPATLLGAGQWRKRIEVFAEPGRDELPSEAALTPRIQQLVRATACFECRLGPRAYEGGAVARLLCDLREKLGAA